MNAEHPIGEPMHLAADYLAGAMSEEQVLAFESHLAQGCRHCLAELRAFDPIAAELFSTIPPATPSPAVRESLLARTRPAENPVGNPQVWKSFRADPTDADLFVRRAGESDWEPTGIEGVDIRRLFIDQEGDRITMLVRMAAGTSYPGHLHSGPEECYVLAGDLHVGDAVLHTGDYQRAARGSRHPVQSTSSGCMLLIVSSLVDEIEP